MLESEERDDFQEVHRHRVPLSLAQIRRRRGRHSLSPIRSRISICAEPDLRWELSPGVSRQAEEEDIQTD